MIAMILDFFRGKKNNSRNKANDRLRLVLSHDRIGASSEIMQKLQDEIIQVISRHLEIEGNPEISLISKGRHSVIDINIPLKGR